VPGTVLQFWFGEPRGRARAEWFRKDARFDEEIRQRFGALHERAARREVDGWRRERESMLALIVVLDQFSRNLHRNDPKAFAQDAYARECAREAIARGDDKASLPVERMFLYLPFEHSEDAAMQDRSLALFGALAQETGRRDPLIWAEKHAAVIRRFGRYPHRNAILGRPSTPEERAFLAEPGSRF